MNVFIDLTGKQKKNPNQNQTQTKTKTKPKPKPPTDFVSNSKYQKGNN